MELYEIGRRINSAERCHLVGIGGVSMSPLAEILQGMGVCITGSDINDGPAIGRLRSAGIDVTVGHAASNVRGAGYVIRSAAAREDNIEIMTARELGIPVFERAQAFGYIMRGYKNAVCVSGVHGKTTTTSMITHILLAAGADPTVMIGGTLPVLGCGYRVGHGDVIVLESDEYYNSFHNFLPTIAIVLNVDADHLDFFRDIDDVKSSFRKFASLVPDGGYIICNGDDADTMEALTPLGRELFTFGFGDINESEMRGGQCGAGTQSTDGESLVAEAAVRGAARPPLRVRGVNVSVDGRKTATDVLYDGELFCKIRLQIPGIHNLKNALAATSAAIALGLPVEAIEDGLAGYTGAMRRLEYKGSCKGAHIYDDYAHHPRELHATLDAVFTLGYRRVIVVFQPHTFSRTKALFSDFVTELSRADVTFLAEIYAAREKNDISISSGVLAEAIPGARCLGSFPEIADEIAAIAREGDIVLTVGAGDIYKVGEMLVHMKL